MPGPKIDASCARGSTSILWALMLLPLLVIIGGALDFSHRETGQRHIQAATDAAAIAAVRYAMTESDDADEVRAAARDFFAQNLPASWPVSTIVPVVEFEANDFVTVSAWYNVPTNMLSIAGISQLKVSAESTAVYSLPRKLEIALVLDNSYSMVGTRLADLKDATTAFKDSMVDASSDQVKLALVPFNNFVNVGVGNRYQSWIDVPADFVVTGTGCSIDADASLAAGCYWETQTCFDDGVPRSCDRLACPTGVSAVEVCYPTSTAYSWYGCVKARTSPLDIEDTSYVSDKVIGRLDYSPWGCPALILPLTNNPSQIQSRIDAMIAEGDTMIFEGLAWGFKALSSTAPFTEGADEAALAAEAGRKIIVLMSDGENSRSPDPINGDHWAADVTYSNGRTTTACDEIRDADIDVYVIAVDVTDPATVSLLEDCAGAPDRFFEIDDSSELEAIFGEITSDLRDIALAK